MYLKTIATASVALFALAGVSFAQQAPAGTPPFASADEEALYQENRELLSGFFTDDTLTTLKSDDEVRDTFAAMDADSQAGMKSACEKAAEDRGSYGTVTTALCDQIGAM